MYFENYLCIGEIIKKNEAHFLLYERLESKDVEIEE